MSLKLTYYGQNDSVNATPDVVLTGDPGTDQTTLINAGYLGGRIMALAVGKNVTNVSAVIVPCDTDSTIGSTETGYAYIVGTGPYNPGDKQYTSTASTAGLAAGKIPFATLLNGPGEFSGAIGPAGSKKAPVVRALWQGNLNQESYDTQATGTNYDFVVGSYVYCGGSKFTNVGLYTTAHWTNSTTPVGICTHVPTTQEPWLGVASLL